MQKVIRRTVLASNQAKRKARIEAAKDRHEQIKSIFREKVALQRSLLDEAAEERRNRREDWMRGPLAPKRDFGDRNGLYGTISTNRLRMPRVLEEQRIKYMTIAPGDRVCMVRGRDRGKIGKVLNVDAESETVTIEGINIYDVEFPSFALAGDSDKRPFRPYPVPVPINDVRLVVPLEDPTTGQVKDVVVKNAYGGAPFLDRPYGSNTPKHTRYISGLNVEIPWPETEIPEYKDEPNDTLRIEVEAKTYVPSLQSFPMPETLIDELRNKYSKYRTRHDPEYVAKKQEADVYQEWLKTRTMLTPKTQYLQKKVEKRIKERELTKNEDGNYTLSKDTANFIEKFMASKLQGAATNASPSA
ncbi:hypothetical protein D8B26_003481 [Coccidioides posadasii str. Silveira]|uniref:Uncharacterized protein n=2 Tax=Coccidioides posadasii TaxID=199306 RepID=E9D159_COCPS|nr:KOW motif containing protein [Coccidioides posadasii C735 delta SOWgp]EER26179.1 KOW motif containing protein [Coccidioides posadasii C735 delta SOWgp]EFW20063.1 conserved hypothetical protein [Coccidioides posadasii str. Silveira]QVM08805.1 hypothetical protein D8B26_003481 [Coccidioides posadasii str. Silveira]|eukprot:XP_003068324.1 KOW motif containing protein [Coccidioides posadasii C735 delta SOWgp]